MGEGEIRMFSESAKDLNASIREALAKTKVPNVSIVIQLRMSSFKASITKLV